MQLYAGSCHVHVQQNSAVVLRPGSGSSSGCWPQRTCLRHGTAFARSAWSQGNRKSVRLYGLWLGAFPCSKGENLRHLHRLHSVRACVPHRCPGDGPGHYQRSQAGGFVPASGGWKRASGSEQVRDSDAERSGLRWLQTLRDGLPHRLPEHSCLPSGVKRAWGLQGAAKDCVAAPCSGMLQLLQLCMFKAGGARFTCPMSLFSLDLPCFNSSPVCGFELKTVEKHSILRLGRLSAPRTTRRPSTAWAWIWWTGSSAWNHLWASSIGF